MNPEIAYGEDVISRIQYCGEHADGRTVLQARLVEPLTRWWRNLSGCQIGPQKSSTGRGGNTVMHYLFAGLTVVQLSGRRRRGG